MGTTAIITEQVRSLIEEVFGAKIFDWYGNTEGCASAAQCEYGNYHINVEYCHIEFIEESNLRYLVGTNLVNHAFPLIRYNIGDIGEPIDHRCPCGRDLPLMKPVAGRKPNIIETPSGKKHFFPNYFSKTLNLPIREFQIIQEKIDSIKLLLVAKPEFSNDDLNKVIHNLKKLLGGETSIDVSFVGKIERSPGGKYQMVVSKL